MFDTKVVVLVLEDLAVWHKLSAYVTVRPPLVAIVHCARRWHLPHASGSNSTVTPGVKNSVSPAGQVMVSRRMSTSKSFLVKSAVL